MHPSGIVTDTAARVGGEKFLLVLTGACTTEAHEIVTRSRMAVAAASAAILEAKLGGKDRSVIAGPAPAHAPGPRVVPDTQAPANP